LKRWVHQPLTLPLRPNDIEGNDPNDALLLAMALGGEADSLVTGVMHRVQIWGGSEVTDSQYFVMMLLG
jgi:predicted nucleic acid-binding protein